VQIQTATDIPTITKEFLVIALSIAIGVAAFLGILWGLGYLTYIILEHTTSTQMLFMCVIGYALIHVARRYLSHAKK